ncbi:hypothetical protein [Kocuria rosea]|uniref:hypothetical protein n=1 Tax=Kocuria rosea TaxID=1275 RepID=UPI000F82B20C|nr:hypothetical protein [Kocuria rosea]
MSRISYVDNGEWRLKLKAFAGGGVLGIGVSYGAEMESFRRDGGKWKKRNVPYLKLDVVYHAVGTGGQWHQVWNPKAGHDVRGDGDEQDDNEIEVAIRGTRVDHPHWPGHTADLKGVEAKGWATLPDGRKLSTGRVVHGTIGNQAIHD